MDCLMKMNHFYIIRMDYQYFLGQCSNAVKSHHEHRNSYKKESIYWCLLTVQKFSSLSSWWHACRHGAKEITENSTSKSIGNKKRETLSLE